MNCFQRPAFQFIPSLGAFLNLFLLCALPAFADSRSYNTTGTLDWVMVEERRPFFSGGNWSPFMGNGYVITSTEGAYFDYYTGFGNGGSAGSGFSHWSTWPIANPINPDDGLKIAYLGTTETGHDSDGAEGTSAGTTGLPPFGFKTNVWYRLAIRCWQPADGTPHVGYAGQWQREETSGVWYHKATFKTPFTVTGINGMGGFIEGLGPSGFRAFHFRNSFAHQYGQPATTIQRANQINIAWNGGAGYGGLIENGTAAIAWSDGGMTGLDPVGQRYVTNMPGGSITVTMTNQPATPPFDPIVVTNYSASVLGSQLLVQWESPDTSSPQLGYKIEVFNNPGYTGSPAVTFFDREPETRQKLLSIPGVATPYVRLIISDIFDNTNAPISITPVAASLSPATNLVGAVNGLSYKYYEAASGVVWSNLPNFSTLTPVLQGAVNDVDTTIRTRRSEYAFHYTGFIQVPTNGIYTFTLTSYDSSKLIVDGVEVINFDGLHQRADKSGWIALAAGYHAVSVQYAFSEQRGQTTYWDDVWLSYEGPGITKQLVPVNAWFRVPGGSQPVIALSSPLSGTTICGSNILLSANITANGATVNKVQYYVGKYSLGQSAASPYSVNALYGPAPTNWLRARLFYNNGYSVDSTPQTLTATTNMNVSPWQLTPLQYHNYPTAARVQGGEVTLLGDYLNLMTRQVTGDFTFVARLAAMTPNVPSTDGRLPDGAWRAGIIIRGTTNLTVGQPLGDGGTTRSTELFSSIGGGTYYEDDTMRLGNGDANAWSGDLGGANRWFKIVRVGDIFYSSISTDGAIWSQVWSNTLPNFGATPYVGMFTYAAQSSNPNMHWATFDNISLVGNVVGDPSVTVSPAAARASVGQSVAFSAGVMGQPPFSYQWRFNGTNIVGATNATLTLINVQLTNFGLYSVSLTAGNGSATSTAAALTVVPAFSWDSRPTVPGLQDGSGNWGGALTNWSDGTGNVAWQDNNTAAFGVNTTTNCTVTLTNDVAPLSLAFNATGGGSYTLAGTNAIRAVGAPLPIAASANATITAVVTGSGGVRKSGAGTLTFNGNDNYAVTGGLFVDGGTLILNTPSFNTFNGGGVYINNGSTFKVTQTGGATRYDFSGKTFTFDPNGGGTIDTSTGVNFVLWGTATFATRGGSQNLTVGSSGFNNNNSIVFDLARGTGVSDLKALCSIWNGGSVTKNGAGILDLAATNTYSGPTTINAGTLWVNGKTAAGAVTVNSPATLGGIGVIGGATAVNPGATLSPGTTNIGTLTISNALTLAGTTLMQISQSAATADKVQGVSTLTCGGTLTVTNLAGTLAAGDAFTLFSAAGYVGNFAAVSLPTLSAGLAWDVSGLSVNGTVSVVAFTGVNPPASAPLNLAAAAVSTSQINVSWSPVASALTYVLSRDGTPIATVSGTSFADTGLSGGTTYCYSVTAVNTGGSSAASPSACATTPITGATLTWDANTGTAGAQDGSGTWGNGAANWLYGSTDLIWADGNAVVFGVNTTTNCTVTITNDVTPAGITFKATGGGSYTVAGSGGGLNLTGAPVISNAANATVTALVKGTGSLTKTGSGTFTLSNTGNSFSGDLTVSNGTLAAVSFNGNAGTCTLGAKSASRIITVAPGSTMNFTVNNIFGGSGQNAASLPAMVIGGTLNATRFNVLPSLTLNGATLAQNSSDGGSYEGYQFIGTVTVGGTSASTISSSNGKANHLINGTTTFNVADATGSAAADLLVSCPLRDASGDYGSSAGSLAKIGAGTMLLSAANTYTGPTTVSGGALLVNGSLAAGTAVTVQTNGTLGGTGIINGPVTNHAGGTLAPGAYGIGVLTFNSSLTLNGNLLVDLNRTNAATSDRCNVTGALAANGAGIVTVNNLGTALVSGDTFTLFNKPVSGAGTMVITPAPGIGLVWSNKLALNGTIGVIPATCTLTYAAGANGTLTGSTSQTVNFGANGTAVTAVPNSGYAFSSWSDGKTLNPRTDSNVTNNISATAHFVAVVNIIPTNIVAFVNGSVLRVTWPSDRIGWQLQVQTNWLSAGLGTNWKAWPGSTVTNVVNVPIVSGNPSVFLRLVYPPQP